MKNLLVRGSFFIVGLVFTLDAWALSPPKRISSKLVDEGKVHQLTMTPGMATIIEVPSIITRIIRGSPEDLQVLYKPTYPKQVVLTLQSKDSKPTNLFIMLGKRKLIFDIRPSYGTHQDFVEIVGSYGGPEFDSEGSSDQPDIVETSSSGVKK